jgi:endo-1,4-beta-xylanase
MKKRLLLVSALAFLSCATQLTMAGGGSGTDHGYYWSYWYSGGSCSISFPAAGTYAGNSKLNWSGCSDALGGKGWSSGSARTIGYNCSLQNCNCFGAYGWTKNPLIEYYVSDMGSHSGTYIGTVSSDGGTYTVYTYQRVNAPSIIGTTTFWQYKSDRQSDQSQNANHAITLGNHINYWKAHCGHGWGSQSSAELKMQGENWNKATGYSGSTIW